MSASNDQKPPDPRPASRNKSPAGKSASGRVTHLPLEDRVQAGRDERASLPRKVHSEFVADPGRPDPVSLLEHQGRERLQELLPIRYGRMLASPFAYYRGSAAVMAWDLGRLPH